MASRLTMPALACPFPASISPHAGEVGRHVVSWACDAGLPRDDAEADRLRAAQVGRLAARTAPRASRAALEFLADWQAWLFLFDDQYCDESAAGLDLAGLSEVVTAFVRVLDGEAAPLGAPARPFTRALAGLMARLSEIATGQQAHRFVSAVRGYFLAQFWEAGHRAASRPPGLAEYVAMRRHSGAVPTCMALTDMADGLELSSREFCDDGVRAVTDMAVNVTCWANDILSYPKEAERSIRVYSLPAVLAAEQNLTVSEALTAAARLHDGEVRRYLAAEEPLRREASLQLRAYLDGLRSWMGGNYFWSLESGRYNIGPVGENAVPCESSSPERAAS